MTRLPRRFAVILPLAVAAACSAPPAGTTSTPPTTPAPSAAPPAARATLEPAHTLPATAAVGETSPGRPDVSVEPLGSNRYRITVADPAAKVWRMTVRPADDSSVAALRVVVATGDIRYAVDATVVTPPAGPRHIHLRRSNAAVCEPTMGVCLAADGVRTPGNPSRHAASFVITIDPDRAVAVTGSTAGWDGEPFVRAPWLIAESVTLGG
ncbi:MAG TPA: hypothetical protein VGK63_07560 [Candidatus Limnocylindrales bacterium]